MWNSSFYKSSYMLLLPCFSSIRNIDHLCFLQLYFIKYILFVKYFFYKKNRYSRILRSAAPVSPSCRMQEKGGYLPASNLSVISSKFSF